jgi:hypothetical protein
MLVLETPGERHGTIDDEAHRRPSLMRSLILSEEHDSLAGFAQTGGGSMCLLAVESGPSRHKFGDGLPMAGYQYFRPVFDLVQESAQLVLGFKRSDFPQVNLNLLQLAFNPA